MIEQGLNKDLADAEYYPCDIELALQATREVIEEWDYWADPHGYCHTRSTLVALVAEIERLREDRFPRQDGNFVVIGPECFADSDGTVISWRGENYYLHAVSPASGDELGDEHDDADDQAPPEDLRGEAQPTEDQDQQQGNDQQR